MHHFFAEPSQITENEIIITGSDVNHMKNVLRLKKNEEVSVRNGIDNREYRCSVAEFSEESVHLKILFVKEDGVEAPAQYYLFQGLPKSDKMELIIQKCVELGVYEIIPVNMKRCVVKLDEKKALAKKERWQAIAEAAAKQSQRAVLPQVHSPLDMEEALESASGLDFLILPYERKEGMTDTKEVFRQVKPGMKIGIMIGPEGGFEEEEVKRAMEMGAKPISLGKRILRTETAGFATLAWLNFHLEVEGETAGE